MKREKLKFIILRTIGNFLFLFSLWGIALTVGPALYYEVLFRYNQLRNVTYVVAVPPSVIEPTTIPSFGSIPTPTPIVKRSLFGDLVGGNKVELISPVSAQFGIVIPKIGANAQIFPNVDAGRQDVYLASLQKGVAHAMGTVFPGVSGNIYLFAHSTDAFWNVGRYNAVFYLLKELNAGDEIDIFYGGVRHIYRVVNRIVVDPSEVHYLTDALPYEQLTLQTCWPPGTTLKRLLILARPERDLAK
jgi:sortase A